MHWMIATLPVEVFIIRDYRRFASAVLAYGSSLQLLWPPAALPSKRAPIDGELRPAISCNLFSLLDVG
jgi:hypothetical protein